MEEKISLTSSQTTADITLTLDAPAYAMTTCKLSSKTVAMLENPAGTSFLIQVSINLHTLLVARM